MDALSKFTESLRLSLEEYISESGLSREEVFEEVFFGCFFSLLNEFIISQDIGSDWDNMGNLPLSDDDLKCLDYLRSKRVNALPQEA